ncbi:MAG: acetyl ornithine aminotransferase family protein [Thermoplasmata archaeon]|nr:acetyl ornithine aminotransferase family protein [Thermoplasmata archaeon]
MKRSVDLPGPKAKAVVERDKAVLSPYNRPFYYPFVVEKGSGCIIEDIDGNEFIDFNSGLGAMNVGHCHPEVVKAITEQCKRLLHYSYTDFYYRYAVELAEKLSEITPGDFPKKAFFSGSGAESIEAFAKVARWHSKRPLFIAYTGGFHGRSMGALSFTASSPVQKRRYFPTMPGVTHVPYAYCYRCPYKMKFPDCDYWCVDFIDDFVLKKYVPAEEVAASLIEPIQGEGGYVVPPKGYHKRLKKLYDKYGILYAVDEVQCGMGRTGKWLAIENFDVVPDIACMSKALGGGISLGATIGRAEIFDWEAGSHCTTLGGTPVACEASLATIRVIEQERLRENAVKMGEHAMKRMREAQETSEIIGDVRGIGLMIGVEIVKDRKTKEPGGDMVSAIIEAAWRKGVVAIGAGSCSFRIAPPLNISQELMDAGLDFLIESIREVEKDR